MGQPYTSYEIAAIHVDGRRVLIGYTPRRSWPGLFLAIRKNNDAMKSLSIPDDAPEPTVKKGADAHILCDGWKIGFTGRTKRDCAA